MSACASGSLACAGATLPSGASVRADVFPTAARGPRARPALAPSSPASRARSLVITGDIKVLSFDREHPLLKDFAPSWPLATSAAAPTGAGGPHAPTDGGASSGGGGGELELELAALTRSTAPRTSELVGPTHYTEKLWAAASLPKSALLSREDAFERVLFAYIDAHKLEAGAGADAAAAAGAAEEEDDWEKAADGGAAGAQGGSTAGAVLLDELLIESLWKVAGGKKKGDEYPRHVPSEDAEVTRAR